MRTLEDLIDPYHRKGRCKARTANGSMCRNRVKKDTEYCYLHRKKKKANKRNRIDKFERAVKISGGAGSLIYTIIKIIEFVVKHWNKFPRIGLHSPRDEKREKLQTVRFRRLCIELSNQEVLTDKDLDKLEAAVNSWLNHLNDSMYGAVAARFGEQKINDLRQELAEL